MGNVNMMEIILFIFNLFVNVLGFSAAKIFIKMELYVVQRLKFHCSKVKTENSLSTYKIEPDNKIKDSF